MKEWKESAKLIRWVRLEKGRKRKRDWWGAHDSRRRGRERKRALGHANPGMLSIPAIRSYDGWKEEAGTDEFGEWWKRSDSDDESYSTARATTTNETQARLMREKKATATKWTLARLIKKKESTVEMRRRRRLTTAETTVASRRRSRAFGSDDCKRSNMFLLFDWWI